MGAGDRADWPRRSHLAFAYPQIPVNMVVVIQTEEKAVELDHVAKQLSIQNLSLDPRSLL